ncbi:hypothetical protein H920_06923 [Fukomys damarensis]|uniref:Uncharacterized protein n=1 Tax=Fukomys damarensis TaxID=885580 RepID=A0A091DI04_FUKDA|nr:hypothetical protein H920_06923 [Fukomys damarensis]
MASEGGSLRPRVHYVSASVSAVAGTWFDCILQGSLSGHPVLGTVEAAVGLTKPARKVAGPYVSPAALGKTCKGEGRPYPLSS